MAEELIESEEPVLEASACHIDRPCYRAKINTENSLCPIMPYVNADAKVILYEPADDVLIFRLDRYKVALRPNELTVGSVPDLIEGRHAVSMAITYLNELWKRRGGVTPNHHARKRPAAFEIYKVLPKSNCKACGEASCLAFATKLALAEAEIDSCAPLNDDCEAKKRIIKLVEGI
ncbi:MAG: hypothetical protein M0022_10590 [Desulfobacteraceae bacterium]|nr:hypothetical protein [Desulfobacteraceae bacterium]